MRVAIGLGSNLGDRQSHIDYAIDRLSILGTVVGVSPVYETAPVGQVEQRDFLNAVVVVETAAEPGEILERCLEIEAERGRVRNERWGPRTLDLDVLLIEGRVVAEPGLEVPHPQLTHRRFVLEPLLDVWPDARLPDGNRLADALSSVSGQQLDEVQPERSTAHAMFNRAAFLIPMVALILGVWWAVGWVIDQLR